MAPINLFDLYAKIALDDSEYSQGVEKAISSSKDVKKAVESLSSPLNKVQQNFNAIRHPIETAREGFNNLKDATESIRHPIETIRNKISDASNALETQKNKLSVLADAYDKASSQVNELTTQFSRSAKENGTAAQETQELALKLEEAEKAAAQAKEDLDEYAKSVKKAGDESDSTADKTGSLAAKLKSALSGAGKIAGAGLAAIGTAAGATAGGLLALESSTEDYRIAQGKLNTAFEAAGMDASDAQYAYQEFYSILGDTDTATEASQLLAQLAHNGEDVAYWSHIAAGVSGTFGDSLPIESLIEASNETAKVGQVTGTLADALNWVGISEDDFNEKLAACSDESERSNLIMETLIDTYDGAANAFWENNEALVESRRNQAQLDQTLAALGKTVSNVKNKLTSQFVPAISNVAKAFNGILTGAKGADKQFAIAIQGLVATAVEALPQFLSLGTQILSNLINGIIQSMPAITTIIPQLITSLASILPLIITLGAQLLTSLVTGIIQSLPTLAAAIPQIVSEIGTALSNLFPEILELGFQLLDQLTTGIENGLPDMVGRLPQIIDDFLGYITTALPKILDKGTEILENLIDGIIKAIPRLIDSLPQIITSFTGFVAENLPKIAKSGVDLLMKLVSGILSAIPDLVSHLPEIMNAIISGLGDLMSGIVDVGKNIIQGIWNGISSGIGWLWEQVKGWGSGLLNNIKGMFGIASPSKEMAWVGKMLVDGLAGAIKKDGKTAVSAAEDLATDITQVMDRLSSGMGTALPTNFSLNANGIVTSNFSGGTYGNISAVTSKKYQPPIINVTINGAKYSDESSLINELVQRVSEELQNIFSRKVATFA